MENEKIENPQISVQGVGAAGAAERFNSPAIVIRLDLKSNIYKEKCLDLSKLDPDHLEEWRRSAVADSIIALNVISACGVETYEYLFYSQLINRRNDGRLRDDNLKRYQHIEKGGWWCSGIDPLDEYSLMIWGCFKPNKPRPDPKKFYKVIKYEHPVQESTRAFFLKVSDDIWEKVAARYGIAVTEEDKQHTGGFWHWIYFKSVPVVIVEGAKKAASLLSAGYAAIGIPGVNNGYRTPKTESGESVPSLRHLIPDLAYFATPGRTAYICFDYETKPETVKNVSEAIRKTGALLGREGCFPYVVSLPGPDKGIDDFIYSLGEGAVDSLFKQALSLEKWKLQEYEKLSYTPSITINRYRIGDLVFPASAKLIGIKSAKGTGKTQSFIKEVERAHANCQRVLIITHRVQLGVALCRRLGVNYVTEIRTADDGQMLGYGVCIDSLRADSQARFNPNDWSGALVIVDEAEQVFWHLLHAKTEVAKHRVQILCNIKALFKVVLASKEGRVILADADLSDISIDLVRNMSGLNIEPYIVLNNYVPNSGTAYVYDDNDPDNLFENLCRAIKAGERVLIHCTGQKTKSKRGTVGLEKYLKKKFPDKKILRIDSKTVVDNTAPAYGCISNLNKILKDYDIVISSPSIETGVSIDIEGHFNSVWGIFEAILSTDSVRQMLARLRETVPRHIWISPNIMKGSLIGGGATNIKEMLHNVNTTSKANFRLLQMAGLDVDEIEENTNRFQNESLVTWAKRACIINTGYYNYRETICEGLKKDGYIVMEAEVKQDSEKLFSPEELKEVRNELYAEECANIAAQEIPSLKELEELQAKLSKTEEEWNKQSKGELHYRYGVPITPDIIKKDDDGWYSQLRLHYYLTVGAEFVSTRDKKIATSNAEAGKGTLFKPDFNKSQLSAAVKLLEALGIKELINSGATTYTRSSEKMLSLELLAKQHKQLIKNYLGVTINQKDTPIAIAQALLDKLGMKLTYVSKKGGRGKQQRVYAFLPLQDGREEVFNVWLSRDSESKQEAEPKTKNT